VRARWRQGESLRLIARRLGKLVPSVRAFVLQTGGVQQHQPTPGRSPCLMAAGGGTRRSRRQGAASQAAMGSSQENQAIGTFRTSSVSVAGIVTQCCIQRIVLALPLPGSGVLQASLRKFSGLLLAD
jgi:hypothetical protein